MVFKLNDTVPDVQDDHPLPKKTQRFKCYLSKPIADKEDPHWFGLVGF